MLIDTNVEALWMYLNPNKKKIVGGGHSSYRSTVCNLREFKHPVIGFIEFSLSVAKEMHTFLGLKEDFEVCHSSI